MIYWYLSSLLVYKGSGNYMELKSEPAALITQFGYPVYLPLVLLFRKTAKHLAFRYFGFVHTWWWLYMRAKL